MRQVQLLKAAVCKCSRTPSAELGTRSEFQRILASMASVAYAGTGPLGQSVGMQESLAAESGVQHPRNAAESTDAETAHGARKRVSHFGINRV